MIKHAPPPLPSSRSSWPTFQRWLESILLPVITAAIIGGVVTMIALREDVAVINTRLAAIEHRLDRQFDKVPP